MKLIVNAVDLGTIIMFYKGFLEYENIKHLYLEDGSTAYRSLTDGITEYETKLRVLDGLGATARFEIDGAVLYECIDYVGCSINDYLIKCEYWDKNGVQM